MAEAKTAPVEDDADEGELDSIRESIRSFDETAIRAALQADGVSQTTIDLLIGQGRSTNEANKKLLQMRERDRTTSYTASLKEQYPYAFDADGKALFSGTTRAEMRRNAERLHNHTAAIVGAAKPAAKPGEAAAAARAAGAADERAEEWGQPPAASGEVVTDRPDLGWGEAKRSALRDSGNPRITEEDLKGRVLDDLKKNGPRAIDRPRIGEILSRQSLDVRRKAQGKTA